MEAFLIAVKFIHVFVCIFLIVVVLLQTGKGSDLSSAFGGGGVQSAFGMRSAATFLTKLTTVCAILFMITSLTQAFLIQKAQTSLIEETDALPQAPAQPAGGVPQSEGGAPLLPPGQGGEQGAPAEQGAPVKQAPVGEAPAPADQPAPGNQAPPVNP